MIQRVEGKLDWIHAIIEKLRAQIERFVRRRLRESVGIFFAAGLLIDTLIGVTETQRN